MVVAVPNGAANVLHGLAVPSHDGLSESVGAMSLTKTVKLLFAYCPEVFVTVSVTAKFPLVGNVY